METKSKNYFFNFFNRSIRFSFSDLDPTFLRSVKDLGLNTESFTTVPFSFYRIRTSSLLSGPQRDSILIFLSGCFSSLDSLGRFFSELLYLVALMKLCTSVVSIGVGGGSNPDVKPPGGGGIGILGYIAVGGCMIALNIAAY